MRILCILLLCICAVLTKIDHKSKNGKEKKTESTTQAVKEGLEVPSLKKFLEILETKRQEHKMAIQSIVDIEDKSKQRLFIEDVLKNIKKLLTDNQDSIERIGHAAEDAFPHESEMLKEALTKIYENLAFFSDLTMRFPKIITKSLKKDRKFKSAAIWAYQYASKSGVLSEETAKVLKQMAQQLEIIEPEDGFFNPFDKDEAKKQIDTAKKDKEQKRKESKSKNTKNSKTKKPDSKKVTKEEL